MKKLFLLFTILCTGIVANAQVVSAYTMQATQGTYTEITDGTVIDLTGLDLSAEEVLTGKAWYPSGIVSEETTAAGFPIGFDFIFNDIACNQFVIGAHGYIALGKDEITNDPSHKQHIPSKETGADNIIGIIPNVFNGIWAHQTTEISYKVIGEAPSRTLVVQFKDWAPNFGWDAESVIRMNMQLRLNETSNTIDFVLGEAIDENDNSKGTRFVLRGYYEDIISLIEGEEEGMINWIATAEDNTPFFGASMVTSGLTYTFTPPAPCEEPSYIQLREVIPATSSFVILYNFPDDADHALLIISESYQLTQNPQDGVFYTEGEDFGGGTVLAYTTDTIYETPEDMILKPSTKYYLHVYAANSFCSNGPLYDAGILGSFSTKPAAPASINITNTTLNTLTFDVESNGTDNVLVIMTDSVRTNRPYAKIIEFGKPIGNHEIGDIVENLGRVVYKGPSAQNIVVEGLEASTAYYLRAHSVDDDNNYSTEVAEDKTATINTTPWAPDLSIEDLRELPVGWSQEGQGNYGVGVTYVDSEEDLDGDGNNDMLEHYLITCNTQANAVNGAVNTLSFGKFFVDQQNTILSFSYNFYIWKRFGGNKPYSDWAEGDTLAVQVCREDGEWENEVLILSTNNQKMDTVTDFIDVELDLTKYLNETVEIRLYWKNFGDQVRAYFDNFKTEIVEIPAVPEAKVQEITHLSAKVTWRGEQENYELTYAKADAEFDTTIVVTGASEYVLTDLEAETEYQVKVRGIVEEGEYSDWSEIVKFTTTEWPECDAPTNLSVQYVEQLLVLTWEGTEDHLLWELRYREANTTSWVTIDSIESPVWVIEDLTEDGTYLWNVRALCTAGRKTAWSAQGTFTIGAAIPVAPVVTATASNDTVRLSWLPVHGATSYKVYYGEQMISQKEETVLNVKVPEVGTYCFTVTAVNELGESPKSDEACATIEADPELEVPAVPVLEAKLASDSALLTWKAVELATYYNVYYITTEGDKLIGASEETEFKIKLSNPGEYCFYITAANLAGESEKSNTDCVKYEGNGNDDDNESIEELSSAINVYPNPVSDKLYIETETVVKEVVIYDVYGRQQELSAVSGQQSVIDVANLNSGVYFVKVVTENGEIVKRFVKK